MKKSARLFVFTMLFAAVSAHAADAPAAKADDKAAADKAAMMEKMKVIMSPGEAHKALEPLAGKWTYTSKMWMAPGAPAEETSGDAENTLIYGGRFLKQEVKGTWMNQPFEGVGYTGYDNIRAQYESVWLDSMATSMMSTSGQFDSFKKVLTQSGANSCPVTGEKDRKGHSEWTVIDNDHNTYSLYMAGPDGKEVKMMEITYVRAV